MVCYLVCNNTADLHQNISAKVEEVSEAWPVLPNSTHSTCLCLHLWPKTQPFNRTDRQTQHTQTGGRTEYVEIFETNRRVRETEPLKPLLACDRILLRANAISIR